MNKLILTLLLLINLQLSFGLPLDSLHLTIGTSKRLQGDIFLEKLQISNPNFFCSWIIIEEPIRSDYSSTEQTHRGLDMDFMKLTETPTVLLNRNFNQTLPMYTGSFHFSTFCNLVAFVLTNLDDTTSTSLDDFIKRPNWVELEKFKGMFSNYFIFLNTKFDSNFIDLRKYNFPFWHPLKIAIHWDKMDNIIVTTFCWHCGQLTGHPDEVTGDMTTSQIFSNQLRKSFEGNEYEISQLFPDYTRNLNRKSLLVNTIYDFTCDELHEATKERLHDLQLPYDWFTIAQLSKKFNFTCNMRPNIPSKISPDIFTGIPLMAKFYQRVVNSPFLASDRLSFCYVQSESKTSWKNILYSFEKPVWLLIVTSWVMCSLLFYIMFQQSGVNFWLWITFSTLLFQDVSVKLSKLMEKHWNPNLRLRLILKFCFSIWLLFSTIMVAAYSSKLSSLLTSPRETTELPQTFEHLLEYGWDLGTCHHLFLDGAIGTAAFAEVRDKARSFFSELDCMKYAWDHPRFACIGMVHTISYFAKRHIPNNTQAANRIKTAQDHTFMTVGTGLAWRWWFPYRERFSELMNHLISSGLPPYWLQTATTNSIKRRVKNSGGTSGQELKVMSLDHLKGSFLVFTIGLVISLLTFFVELCVGWVRHCCIRRGINGDRVFLP